MSITAHKRIIILGGLNGAGKTTFAREFLPNEAQSRHFINADLIATGLSPFAPDRAAIRAGRLMLSEIKESVNRSDNFAFETTLSGSGFSRKIPEWQALGYRVVLFFLSLPDVAMAVSRVALRVRQGGHDIPETVIRRRFISGLHNFHHVYKHQVDSWALYDNTDSTPMLLDWGENR